VGTRDSETKLWRLLINPTAKLSINPTSKPSTCKPSLSTSAIYLHMISDQQANHLAFNVYTIPRKQNQLKYMHHSFFSNATTPTLLKAINNNQLDSILLMKADLVHKYLSKSPATSKGRMKRPWAGIQSTWSKPVKKASVV